jgi:hypothetical protein
MPLLDHFRAPLSVERPWDGVHSAWASAIAAQLNRDLLPPDYFAMPQVTFGGGVEIDVATSRQAARSDSGNGTVATALWAPPALSAAIDFANQPAYEVRVMQTLGGPRLRAAVELVSPRNKDRPAARHAFAVKCAGYLQLGVSVLIVDAVTERLANLHEELVTLLGLADRLNWSSASKLYAIAYRVGSDGESRLDVWPAALAVGEPLPTVPLWLEAELVVGLDLEESYLATCAGLRIAT